MGCCAGKFRCSLILADDDEKVIKRNLELKLIADPYNDTIIPSIKSHLADVVRWLEDVLSGVSIIRRALVCSHPFNEKKKKRLRKVNVYTKIVAELNKLIFFPSYLAPGTLEETKGRLRLQMDRISKRQRSMKRWRRACTAVVMAVTVGLLMASIGLALAGAAPRSITSATSGATAIKAVLETSVNAALEDKERKLKQEEEVVEMLQDGEQLMVHEFHGVRRLPEEIVDKYLNFVKHIIIKAAEKAAPEMEKMIDEIESDAMELKEKVNHYWYKIEQFEVKFNGMIQKK